MVDWEIFTSFATTHPPDIAVSVEGENAGSLECIINIAEVPSPPQESLDWRLGHTVNGYPDYRGTETSLTFEARADPPVTFASASVYSSDGVSGSGIPLQGLTGEWQRFTVTQEVSENATTLEFWIRLFLENGASNPSRIQIQRALLAVHGVGIE
ncbi:MAG: hypothetical protein JJ899_10565 [Alphaproteobacteria bacterium]|nr:hypothetical protein [Alphaproteobacteria bacterium]